MFIRSTGILAVAAISLAALAGCTSATKLNSLWPPSDGSNTAANTDPAATGTANGAETTGTVNVTPAEPGGSGEPVAPLAQPGLLGDDPNDDLQRGKRYFRNNDFGNAERSFRTATERHPNDAEAWVGLAASYDRLRRFDLADRAYHAAMRIVGRTPEVLNDQGFSYILRGDYARAQKTLQEARKKDPNSPYIAANLQLLEESAREGKSVQ
jgi:tetratricopeptide (TPR) repeat protein